MFSGKRQPLLETDVESRQQTTTKKTQTCRDTLFYKKGVVESASNA